MNRAIMLSIQPRHCENICTVVGNENGKPIYKKTIEVRKKAPKCDTPFKCYIYCTKDMCYELAHIRFSDGWAVKHISDNTHYANGCTWNIGDTLNGKVIGEFICDEIERLYIPISNTATPPDKEAVEKATCLSFKELKEYANGKMFLYGLYITDLKIYDEPKELGEFSREIGRDERVVAYSKLTRPPQSWAYVEEL